MTSAARTKQSKSRPATLSRRLNALTAGLTVARILKADDRELVIEFSDGTRLFVRSGDQLEISVT